MGHRLAHGAPLCLAQAAHEAAHLAKDRVRVRVRVRAWLRLRPRLRDRLAHGVHEAAHLVAASTGRVSRGRSREGGVSRGLRH